MSRSEPRNLKASIAGIGCALASAVTMAGNYFNPAMLKGGGLDVVDDLSVFEESGNRIPGNYFVDIYLNRRKIASRALEFKLQTRAGGKQDLEPCLSLEQLASWGVRVDQYPGMQEEAGCARLSAIPQASSEFLFSSQRLELSVPQAAMKVSPRGRVPRELWDDGETAMLLNYNLSGSEESASTGTRSGQYLNLLPGLNLGSWRIRNYSTWQGAAGNQDEKNSGGWKSIYTYAQRSLPGLGAALTLGESSSAGDVFDAVPFRGAQLATDEEMLPDSQRGFAPIVRGIARTNARVTIRQNGYVIYEGYVAPGAFSIADLYPTGSNGDLGVAVEENDGSEQHFVVPFATLPILRREGSLKFSVLGGEYRPAYDAIERTRFAQFTGIYGLGDGYTVFGGAQAAEVYKSQALGVGKNLGTLGALSLDLTQARSQPQREKGTTGQSWRVRYSKDVVASGTNVAIAAYRYSTRGYSALSEVLDTYRDDGHFPLQHPRNRFELTVDQRLGDRWGTLSVGVFNETHWNSARKNQSISLGYSNSWKWLTAGVNFSYSNNEFDSLRDSSLPGGVDKTSSRALSVNFSVPLDGWMGASYASYSLGSSDNGPTSSRVGVTGRAWDDQLTWGAQQGYTGDGRGRDGNLDVSYLGAFGEFDANYFYDSSRSRTAYRAKGGAVLHEGGLTFGQTLGESVALVETPGASDVAIRGRAGVATDARGFAIDPYLAPYRANSIALALDSLPDHVEVEEALKDDLVPTRGAVLHAAFKTKVGLRALVTLRTGQGQLVPFGAAVSVEGRPSSGTGDIVGSEGKTYLTGMPGTGTLRVSWGGRSQPQQCAAPYDFSRETEIRGIIITDLLCQ